MKTGVCRDGFGGFDGQNDKQVFQERERVGRCVFGLDCGSDSGCGVKVEDKKINLGSLDAELGKDDASGKSERSRAPPVAKEVAMRV